MTRPAAGVQLREVARWFGDGNRIVHAVRPFSLTIHRSTLTLLIGPSGSGKTTLLSLAGGLLRPSGGEVEVASTRIDRLSQRALTAFRLRHVGFVFQRFRLLDGLSALENIELPMTLAGVRRPESGRRALELAQRVGLSSRLAAGTRALSGGEQQRVAIARALANAPDVVLADEPTGSLDSESGHQVIELLHDVATRGAAVLVASHDARLEPYASEVVRMEDGRRLA